jgi:hypothetical protein
MVERNAHVPEERAEKHAMPDPPERAMDMRHQARKRVSVKRAALFAVVVLAALTVLGTRHGGNATARAAAAGAAARTLGAGSSRFTVSVEARQPLSNLAPGIVGEGVMDYIHHRGRLSYGRYSEQIFDGNVTFMTWPMPWHERARWLRVESDSSDTDPFDLRQRAMRNPAGLLEFLTAASEDAHDAGSERVRGTTTTRIEGTFDMQKVVDQSPPDQRAELQDWLNFLAEDAPTTVPFQLWIDGDGVARRLRVEQGGEASVMVEYYDFGVPVTVSAPPASEIITAQELAAEIQAQAAGSDCGSSGDVYSTGSGGSICVERVE